MSNHFPEAFCRVAEQLIQFGQKAHSRGWVPATSSNFSMRVADDVIAVTSSGKHKGELETADLLAMTVAGSMLGEPYPQGKPSAEAGLHSQLYQLFPDTRVVLHIHSLSSVCLSRLVKDNVIHIYGHEIAKAFPNHPTHEKRLSIPIVDNNQDIPALCKELLPRLQREDVPNVYLIRGHGLYAWGNTMAAVERYLEAADFLFQAELIERRMQ